MLSLPTGRPPKGAPLPPYRCSLCNVLWPPAERLTTAGIDINAFTNTPAVTVCVLGGCVRVILRCCIYRLAPQQDMYTTNVFCDRRHDVSPPVHGQSGLTQIAQSPSSVWRTAPIPQGRIIGKIACIRTTKKLSYH